MSHDSDPDFTNPKLNGEQPMSAEKIAAVLAEHDEIEDTREAFTCICGYGLGNWTGDVGGRFRLHKAAMLEPVIKEREAAAWDEGYHKAKEHGDFYDTNPSTYREES